MSEEEYKASIALYGSSRTIEAESIEAAKEIAEELLGSSEEGTIYSVRLRNLETGEEAEVIQ